MKIKFSFLIILISVIAISVPVTHAGQDEDQGTFAAPKVAYVGVLGDDGLTVRRSVFSYNNGADEVVGTTTSVHFTLDRPAKVVWPIFQNFNLWQTQEGVSFTGAFGDKEGELEYLIYHVGNREKVSIDNSMAFIVQQLVPEHVIVLHSPLWERVGADGKRLGNRHEGKNVFMLSEVNGKTTVTAVMEHAYHYYGADAKSNAEAGLKQRLKIAQNRKRDIWEGFVPRLRQLVEGK
ncbi:MAG: hypothetical protein AB8B86_17570 [Pseudomonadales bacterium]